jgi:hypothetical protein
MEDSGNIKSLLTWQGVEMGKNFVICHFFTFLLCLFNQIKSQKLDF